MYNGFQYAPNQEVETYIGTVSTDDFEDDFIDKLGTDVGIVCYKQITESSGSYSLVSTYYIPTYEDDVFSGYEEFEEVGL